MPTGGVRYTATVPRRRGRSRPRLERIRTPRRRPRPPPPTRARNVFDAYSRPSSFRDPRGPAGTRSWKWSRGGGGGPGAGRALNRGTESDREGSQPALERLLDEMVEQGGDDDGEHEEHPE